MNEIILNLETNPQLSELVNGSTVTLKISGKVTADGMEDGNLVIQISEVVVEEAGEPVEEEAAVTEATSQELSDLLMEG